MTVIGRETLKKLIEEQNVITDYKNIEKQLTPNGFDFRLAALIEVTKAGQLRIDKAKAKKPEFGTAWIMEEFENHINDIDTEYQNVIEEGTLIELYPKNIYLAITCESLNTPENLNFEIAERSSLLRYCQCGIMNGFGEAGYRGNLTVMLKPYLNGAGIDIGVSFIQLIFNKLDSNGNYDNQKTANYQDGKIL